MKLDIKPYVGVGPLIFGMTQPEVRQALGSSHSSFKKTPFDELPTDAFDSLGVHVSYRTPGVCEAVEMWGPADPTLEGKQIMGKPFDEIRDWVRTLDPKIEIDETGLISIKLGLSVYAPGWEEDQSCAVEGVLAFEEGYYEED